KLVAGKSRDLHAVADGFDPVHHVPWDASTIEAFLRSFVNCLAPESMSLYDEPVNSSQLEFSHGPRLYDCPVIYTRSRTDSLWEKELKAIVRHMKSGASAPPAIRALTTNTPPKSEGETNDAWRRSGEEILFPLPSNDEQRMIVDNLARYPGVAVQGP